MNFECHVPATIIYGKGSRFEAPKQALKLLKSRALLITDQFFAENGVLQTMRQAFEDQGIASFIFDEVEEEPDVSTVLAAAEILKKNRCDIVVSIGGGSVIDVGKAVAVVATNHENFAEFSGYYKVKNNGMTHIAIPTTAGTGTEATRVATIRDRAKKIKMTCFDDAFMPDISIVDYELSMTMPQSLTAMAGCDAFAHAVEAFISAKANPVADMYALLAIQLINEHLIRAFENPADETARKNMMMGANYAGIAISNSSVCAVHAMARPLGVRFGMKHGIGHAILLPIVTEYSIAGALPRYAAIARAMGFSNAYSDDDLAMMLVDRLRELNERLSIPNPRIWGVDKKTYMDQIDDMVEDAIATGTIDDNPRVFTHDEIARIYQLVYDYQ